VLQWGVKVLQWGVKEVELRRERAEGMRAMGMPPAPRRRGRAGRTSLLPSASRREAPRREALRWEELRWEAPRREELQWSSCGSGLEHLLLAGPAQSVQDPLQWSTWSRTPPAPTQARLAPPPCARSSRAKSMSGFPSKPSNSPKELAGGCTDCASGASARTRAHLAPRP